MRRISAGLVAVLFGVCLLAGQATALTPHFTVSPRTGLTDGEMVRVSGRGWRADSHIQINECSAGIWTGDQNACSNSLNGFTYSFGTVHRFSFSYRVVAGGVGDGLCGLKGSKRSCAIEVIQLDKNDQPTSTVVLRHIVFS